MRFAKQSKPVKLTEYINTKKTYSQDPGKSMFQFLKSHISSLYEKFTEKARSLFSRGSIDDQLYEDIAKLLRSSDLGSSLTRELIKRLKEQVYQQSITTSETLQRVLHQELQKLVSTSNRPSSMPEVLVLVGINGSGKTTTAGKLARLATQEGKRVLLIAGDTFRAAATEQLQGIGRQANVDVFTSEIHTNPSSLIFEGCKKYKEEDYTCLIIDTAGRLQTKINLMDELAKIKRIISKQLPDKEVAILLTIDAMLGQNSLEQARIFHQATTIQGVIATKLDGSAKGGALIAIIHELKIPVWFYTFGEKIDQIGHFDSQKFVDGFFE